MAQLEAHNEKKTTPCQRNSRQLHCTPGQVHRRIAQWNFSLGLVYISFARMFSSNMRVAPVDSSLSSFYQFRPQHGVVIGKRLSTSILCGKPRWLKKHPWNMYDYQDQAANCSRSHATNVWPKSPHSSGSWKCLNRSSIHDRWWIMWSCEM